MKSTNTQVHQCAIKIRHSYTDIRRNYFTLRVATIWNSSSNDTDEFVSLNEIKTKMNDHCQTRSLAFDLKFTFTFFRGFCTYTVFELV